MGYFFHSPLSTPRGLFWCQQEPACSTWYSESWISECISSGCCSFIVLSSCCLFFFVSSCLFCNSSCWWWFVFFFFPSSFPLIVFMFLIILSTFCQHTLSVDLFLFLLRLRFGRAERDSIIFKRAPLPLLWQHCNKTPIQKQKSLLHKKKLCCYIIEFIYD